MCDVQICAKPLPAWLMDLVCWVQNMVEARNANYLTIARHLSFAKRGAPNVDDVEVQGSGKSDKQHSAAETYDNGSDSDTEAPEPRLLRVRVPASADTHPHLAFFLNVDALQGSDDTRSSSAFGSKAAFNAWPFWHMPCCLLV